MVWVENSSAAEPPTKTPVLRRSSETTSRRPLPSVSWKSLTALMSESMLDPERSTIILVHSPV